MKANPILGWDVGGANIKAARLCPGSGLAEPRVCERAFPLWRDPGRLPDILSEVAGELGCSDFRGPMALTMTAELADCFRTRREGVAFVLDAFDSTFPDADVRVFGVDGTFRSIGAARRDPLNFAAANWMATSMVVAETFPDAILIDIGSTTTDIIPIVGGRVVAVGKADTDRLACGELVYTGLLRTPVCAIVGSVPVRGRDCRVAAEHFAIAADVYLWLGKISGSDYTCETPDDAGRSRDDAGVRIRRMVCGDLDSLTQQDVTTIARHVAARQAAEVRSAIGEVRARLGGDAPGRAVLAGHGLCLARAALEGMEMDVVELAHRLGRAAAGAGPASAAAWLLGRTFGS